MQPACFIRRQHLFVGQVGAHAVDHVPGHGVEPFFDQQLGDLAQALAVDVGRIVEHADLLRAEVFDQVAELGHNALRRARPPLLGHDGLRAEGAAVGTAARGHHAEAARPLDRVHGRLQRRVALHLEEVVGRPGQGIQVVNGRAVAVASALCRRAACS